MILRHALPRTIKISVAAAIMDSAVSPILNLIIRNTGIRIPARTQAAVANGNVTHAARQHRPMTSLYRYSSQSPIAAANPQPASNNTKPRRVRASEPITASRAAKTARMKTAKHAAHWKLRPKGRGVIKKPNGPYVKTTSLPKM